MRLSILLVIMYHITLLSKNQISVSSYFTSISFIVGVSVLVTFLVGVCIVGFMIESDIIWFLFNGFNYEDYAEDVPGYIRGNLFHIIFLMGAIVTLFLIAPKII